MRAYADSSFLVRLLTLEPGAEQVRDTLRRLRRPRLLFHELHDLEVTNALRLKAFFAFREVATKLRPQVLRLRDHAFERLRRSKQCGLFREAEVDWPAAFRRSLTLSAQHAERIGCRSFDTLHVSCALELGCDRFLTSDQRQSSLARAAGLNSVLVALAE